LQKLFLILKKITTMSSNSKYLASIDPELNSLLVAEEKRQEEYLTLIPSENYTHPAVMEALGSVCTNKYSEGYPGRRYYNGNKYIDQIEDLARERTKQVFQAKFANVQPYSGSPANLAVYFALLNPGDTVMGIELSHGGHLTHGAKVSFSGKWFKQVPIVVDGNGRIDYDEVEQAARLHKPKMIIAGVTAYPREVDYARLAKVAKTVGAYLVADVSHTNGLVIAGIHSHPLKVGADVLTSTTHKLLRGPRGAVIVTDNPELATKIDKAIMPGLQGGPHNHQTAAIALAMQQALQPEYTAYAKKVAANAQVLAKYLMDKGFQLVSSGTDNHLMLIDLREIGLNGREAADLLESAGLVVNANTIPNDSNPPLRPSGIRIGTPAVTTRGMGEPEMVQIANVITAVLKQREPVEKWRQVTLQLCKEFPISNFY
jgi:glycine hydroxymethyltransferase